MADDLAPIAAKLAKLVRLLSSDEDNEVVATVHAIKRMLKTKHLDLHTLADHIKQPAGGTLSQEDMAKLYWEGFADGLRQAEAEAQQQPVRFTDVNDGPSWHQIACECRDHERWRDKRERGFVLDRCG
jgi:hypothetical protein